MNNTTHISNPTVRVQVNKVSVPFCLYTDVPSYYPGIFTVKKFGKIYIYRVTLS